MTARELQQRLEKCPDGQDGWKEFEDICTEILRFLFCPPLIDPIIQPRTFSGIDRRDAVFPNRNLLTQNNWAHLLKELDARLVLCEFKNYDKTEIGKDEI